MILPLILKLYFLFQKIFYATSSSTAAIPLHLHQDHQDNRSQGLWAELGEKQEGGRGMQPGRPAYPHWGSSHPPTSAQTPTRNQKRPQNDKEDATDSLHQLIAFLLERLIKSLSIVNSLQRGQCSRRVRRVCPLPGCLKPIPSALEVWDLWRIGNTGDFHLTPGTT